VTERHGLPASDAVYVAEIDLDAAEQLAPAGDLRVQSLPRYPSVTRDISILVDDTIAAAQIRHTIRDAAPPILATVREFDRYQGKGVPDGKVALAVHLVFRSPERTLTDAEVDAAMAAIVSGLEQQHGAIRR
jgi:phenylalanyl-tRNA synthetase beta chain